MKERWLKRREKESTPRMATSLVWPSASRRATSAKPRGKQRRAMACLEALGRLYPSISPFLQPRNRAQTFHRQTQPKSRIDALGAQVLYPRSSSREVRIRVPTLFSVVYFCRGTRTTKQGVRKWERTVYGRNPAPLCNRVTPLCLLVFALGHQIIPLGF